MRVGIIAFLHESNTFVPKFTGIEQFEANLLLTGESIRTALAKTHHEIGGFFQGLALRRIEAVPIFVARAVPSGTIAAAAFDQLLTQMLKELGDCGGIDGLLVAPHGATVSQHFPDADGYWLSRIRAAVGRSLPIIGTLDPHANLSPLMVSSTNALIAYRTNPHLDQLQCGLEAADLMARTLAGEIVPVQAASFPPLAINIERQLTSEAPLSDCFAAADRMLEQPQVLSNSLLLGFPYADVAEMGSAAIAVTDNDQDLAEACAQQLADKLWENRHQLVGRLISIDAALEHVANLTGTTCLLDMGDNVGGGSPADSTHLLHALRQHQIAPSLACIYDPQSVALAREAGVGACCELSIGGKSGSLHGAPFTGIFRVQGLFDGKFVETQPRHGGFTDCDQGPSAAVVDDYGMTVLLTSLRIPPFSLQQLTSCQLDPSHYRAIVAKGVNAPVAAYQEVCANFIRVNTPGCTTADMQMLEYQHRRRPMFPFEDL